jgi:hypothetical protein
LMRAQVFQMYLLIGRKIPMTTLRFRSSVIIKGKKNRPAAPLSIQEAAIFAAACSSAWDAKVAVNAYWVYPEQVSRTAPSGMYLQQGSFVIRGSRNYVPVTTSGSGPLVMGFGFNIPLQIPLPPKREVLLVMMAVCRPPRPQLVSGATQRPTEHVLMRAQVFQMYLLIGRKIPMTTLRFRSLVILQRERIRVMETAQGRYRARMLAPRSNYRRHRRKRILATRAFTLPTLQSK